MKQSREMAAAFAPQMHHCTSAGLMPQDIFTSRNLFYKKTVPFILGRRVPADPHPMHPMIHIFDQKGHHAVEVPVRDEVVIIRPNNQIVFSSIFNFSYKQR